jgi:hypothetical protein
MQVRDEAQGWRSCVGGTRHAGFRIDKDRARPTLFKMRDTHPTRRRPGDFLDAGDLRGNRLGEIRQRNRRFGNPWRCGRIQRGLPRKNGAGAGRDGQHEREKHAGKSVPLAQHHGLHHISMATDFT